MTPCEVLGAACITAGGSDCHVEDIPCAWCDGTHQRHEHINGGTGEIRSTDGGAFWCAAVHDPAVIESENQGDGCHVVTMTRTGSAERFHVTRAEAAVLVPVLRELIADD